MIDIVMATYQGERFLRDQMDSLFRQSFQDFRLIVRDDGSTDRTLNILRRFREIYPDRIRILEAAEGEARGACANFMRLMRLARSPYLMLCDQDDVWFPEKVGAMLTRMREEEASRGADHPILVYSDYQLADEKLAPLDMDEDRLAIGRGQTDLARLLVQNTITGCTVMMNRSAYRELGSYDSRILMHDWWAGLYVSVFGTLVHMPRKLMFYRQHGNNQVSAADIRSLSYRWKKLTDKGTRQMMHLYYSQAALFCDRYGESIPLESRAVIGNFADLVGRGKLSRIRGLVEGGYLKSDLIRILGQLWFC